MESRNERPVFKKDTTLCSKKWTVFKVFKHQGHNSDIYTVCDRRDCNYLVKVMNIQQHQWKKEFYQEAKIYQVAAKAGLAPMVHDVFECDGYGYIVSSLINAERLSSAISSTDTIHKILNTLIVRLAKAGILFFDARPDNVLLDTKAMPPKIIAVDFGNSYLISDMTAREAREKATTLTTIYKGDRPVKLPLDIGKMKVI